MKMHIRAERVSRGQYRMVAVGGGKREYPQDGKVHPTRQSVYDDASAMYDVSTWQYDDVRRTIQTD